MLARLATALLLAVASVVLLGSAPAHACRCVLTPMAGQVEAADAVFVGTFGKPDRLVTGARVSFELTVTDVYRGQVPDRVTVRTPYSSASCGLGAVPAGRPVVWFARSTGSELLTDSCSGTAPLTPQLERRLSRVAGPPEAPTPVSDPSGQPSAGSPEDGSSPGDTTSPGDTATSEDGTGSTAAEDGSADGSAAASDGGLPWWGWTLLGLVAVGAAGAALTAARRRP